MSTEDQDSYKLFRANLTRLPTRDVECINCAKLVKTMTTYGPGPLACCLGTTAFLTGYAWIQNNSNPSLGHCTIFDLNQVLVYGSGSLFILAMVISQTLLPILWLLYWWIQKQWKSGNESGGCRKPWKLW